MLNAPFFVLIRSLILFVNYLSIYVAPKVNQKVYQRHELILKLKKLFQSLFLGLSIYVMMMVLMLCIFLLSYQPSLFFCFFSKVVGGIFCKVLDKI